MKSIHLFLKSLKFLFSDKVSLILTLIPIFVGLLLYFSSFYFIYGVLSGLTSAWLLKFFSSGSWILSSILFLLKSIMGIIGFFLVNWTFVLLVSLIGSPLNDFISERVEKKLHGKPLQNLNQSFKSLGSKVLFIIFNEIKKISLILILSIIAFILGFIPFLTPFALGVSFLLISIQFVDYTWARHDLKFKECIQDTRKHILFYGISGAIYFALINIPFVNLFVPAIATIHYTFFFNEKNKNTIIG